jgi:hypothetical protein
MCHKGLTHSDFTLNEPIGHVYDNSNTTKPSPNSHEIVFH